MQSGISATRGLHEAFAGFVEDTSLFCLPVTIDNEELIPGLSVPFNAEHVRDTAASASATAQARNDAEAKFFGSLSGIEALLQPSVPIYLLLRRPYSSSGNGGGDADGSEFIAVTYVPTSSPVRSKTLFASTRATLVRELGSEKFASTVFAVEAADVLEPAAWRERDGETVSGSAGVGAGAGEEGEEAMTETEKKLLEVRRQESEARSGMSGRDTGMAGEVGGGADTPLRLGDGLVDALLEVGREEGMAVVLTIDVPTETFLVASKKSNVSPADVPSLISNTKPQYTFYRYPDTPALIFIYTCPMAASIKERMLNASSRLSVVKLAQAKGLNVTHKIEASGADEITKERLEQEVNPPKQETQSRGFARPKRPGR